MHWINNKFEVDKSGKYTVYVKDRLGNVASKEINVTIVEKKDDGKQTENKIEDNKKEEINDEDIKAEDTKKDEKIDNTVAKKEFGQYGSTPIVISILFILTTAGCIAYIKSKNIRVK